MRPNQMAIFPRIQPAVELRASQNAEFVASPFPSPLTFMWMHLIQFEECSQTYRPPCSLVRSRSIAMFVLTCPVMPSLFPPHGMRPFDRCVFSGVLLKIHSRLMTQTIGFQCEVILQRLRLPFFLQLKCFWPRLQECGDHYLKTFDSVIWFTREFVSFTRPSVKKHSHRKSSWCGSHLFSRFPDDISSSLLSVNTCSGLELQAYGLCIDNR